ncbi:MAG TPA: hypothetical protein VF813_01515, partial [Anaerolineaceae bacterium]
MVIHGEWSGQRLTISDKPGCLTISLEKPLETSVYSFDYAGRLWTAFDRGISYRRGLDGKVVAKWELRNGSRDRRWLAPSEAEALEEQARCLAVELSRALRQGETGTIQPVPDRVLSGLGRAALYDRARAEEDITRYHQVYLPVGILPPDQYMAVVLQLTEGCSFNTCTFCNFYRGTAFRIKTPSAFRAHIQQVKDFLGEAISLRRTIFLGDANALVTPIKKLIPLLEVVREQFDI